MELCHTAVRSGRLSGFLKGELGLSTGLMNRLKWQNAILVNGRPVHTDYPVQPGDQLTVLLDEPEPDYPAEDVPLDILYEDAHLLAVDKPVGMLIHPSRVKTTGTLANAVAGYYRRTGQHSAFHPVTRLDRDTYGLVLLAKNAHIHAAMNQLHAQAGLVKRYHALVFGAPAETNGIIDAPIARLPLPSLLREIRADGKPSRTEYTLLERQNGYSKLALRPVTGRTHQLRLHCKAMGCPILGDPQYGSEQSQCFSRKKGLTHQMLCAVDLEFSHPVTGTPMKISSHMDVTLP